MEDYEREKTFIKALWATFYLFMSGIIKIYIKCMHVDTYLTPGTSCS